MGNSALVVIDMINDFVFNKEGPLYCENGEKTLHKIEEAIDFFHDQNQQVIFIQDAHRKNDGDFSARPVHAVNGTWGAEIIAPLRHKIVEQDYIISKRRYSGFSYTDLDLFLREEKMEKLVLIGGWTNTGIRSTASDAFYQAYQVIVLSDCCFSQSEDMHRSGLIDISMFGQVVTLEEYKRLVE